MGFISKVELKKQLREMGIKVEGNYVKKKDVEKVTKVVANKPDIYDLRNALEEISDKLMDVKKEVSKVSTMADSFGGEIKRVVGGQLDSYLSGTLDNFINNEDQPGSIASLLSYLNEEYEEEE